MNTELFKEYVEIDAQIKALEDKRSEIKSLAKKEMENNQIDKVDSDFGSFFFQVRKSYKFSDALTDTEKQVAEELKMITEAKTKPIEDAKAKEIEDGVAEVKESKSLAFRAKK